MPAVTLSKDEVRNALQHFRQTGRPRPGLHRLLQHIGHGSIPRLKRLMQEIDLEEIHHLDRRLVEQLPDPVTLAAANLWNEMASAVEGLERDAETRIRDRIAAVQAREQEALAEIEQLKERLARAEQAATEQAAAHEQEVNAHAQTAERLTQQSALAQRLAEELEREKHAHQETRALLSALDQKSMAREGELLARIDTERQRTADEPRAAQQRLQQAQDETQALHATLARLKEAHAGAQASLQATVNHLREQLEAASARTTEDERQHKAIRQELDDARVETARLTGVLETLESARADLKKELEECNRRNAALRRENEARKEAIGRLKAKARTPRKRGIDEDTGQDR
jgi:chromosome segregation ATPase